MRRNPAERVEVQPSLIIRGREIGAGHPPYVVAEISANHKGDLSRALELIDAAADAGTDAVKIQTYTADTMTLDIDREDFMIREGPWAGQSLYQLYQNAYTPWEWHPQLFERAAERQITLFSSPFDVSAVDLLESLGCPAYKVASFELVDLPLIAKIAGTGKPMILSTGMASQDEIAEAIETARNAGGGNLAILHCVSAYPTPIEDANLQRLHALREHDLVVGLSDHTLGTVVPAAAVAIGASIIEKHVTIDRQNGGPDATFSLEPNELQELVAVCREVWTALGDGKRKPGSERGSRTFRRSLYVVRDVKAGALLGRDDVRSIRPGRGLSPRHLTEVIGRRVVEDIPRGTPLAWRLLEEDAVE